MNNTNVIGICSSCGGYVCTVSTWHGVTPPPPAKCSSCGRLADQKLPIVQTGGNPITPKTTDTSNV